MIPIISLAAISKQPAVQHYDSLEISSQEINMAEFSIRDNVHSFMASTPDPLKDYLRTQTPGIFNNLSKSSDSNEELKFCEITPLLNAVFFIVYNGISFFSILGNTFIIMAVLRCKKMHNVTNYFIINLAIADIIVSLFATPFQYQAAILQYWKWPHFLCKLAPFATTLSVNVSIFTLVAITLDRAYAIIYPFRIKLKKHEFIIIVFVIWFMAFLFSSFNFYNYKINEITTSELPAVALASLSGFEGKTCYSCDVNNMRFFTIYMLSLTTIQFLLPIIVFVFTYLAIYTKLTYKYHSPHSPNNNLIKNKKKVIKMIFIVLIIFIICWSPLQIYNLLQFFYPDINKFYYINLIWISANGLAMSNSCYNVIIYGICSTRYKNQFRKMLHMKPLNEPIFNHKPGCKNYLNNRNNCNCSVKLVVLPNASTRRSWIVYNHLVFFKKESLC